MTNSQIVRKKYPRAYSLEMNGKWFINSGSDKEPFTGYRPKGAIPYGFELGKGNTLKKAWKDTSEKITNQ